MSPTPFGFVDELLTFAFAHHATDPRHAGMRQRFRATSGARRFEVFLARLYGLSWGLFLVVAVGSVTLLTHLPPSIEGLLLDNSIAVPFVDTGLAARAINPGLAVLAGLVAKWATIRAGGRLLATRARRRRDRIERTLPRTVRYMHVLASGTTDARTLFSRVADRERAFGETARSFQAVLGTATVTGSLDGAIGIVARDTPSRRVLAPFLLTLRARSREGPSALTRFLHLESRMLARRDAQRSGIAKQYLGLVVRLFVALLVVPAVAVVGLVVATGFGRSTWIPATDIALWIRRHVLLSPVSAIGILLLGSLASVLVYSLRPPAFGWSRYQRSTSLRAIVRTAHRNPANALIVLVPIALVIAGVAWRQTTDLVAVVTLGYVLVAVPSGLVDWRRASLDAAKDRYLPDLLHAIARQVHLGRSFTEAVDHVARDEHLGPLDHDVADLAFDLHVARNDRPVRAGALDRFVDRVGTPLAERTVGMIAGALEAGSQTAAAFEALQSEAGRLYHEERAVKDEVPVFLAVGWVGSLLVIGIVVAVNVAAIGTTVPGGPETSILGVGDTTGPLGSTRGTPTFYLLTQATMLASGWFAGVAGRGVYEGLLHSGALVLVAFVAFVGTGLL
jgi:archaellum biogenesis protein FlaJ (TadC family)